MKSNKVLAIIPARSGSKRIPGKNIRFFCGKPIIKYSIDTALGTGIFNETIVSTDSVEIAKLCTSLGASAPFLRSEKNSNDSAIISEVVCEILDEYEKIGKTYDYVCCIYATAPFITKAKILKSYDLINKKKVKTVLSVTRFSYPIQRALVVDSDNKLVLVQSKHKNSRSQDLESCFHDAGQFFWLEVSSFRKTKEIFSDNTLPFEISNLETQDIDTEEDWKLAENKYSLMQKTEKNSNMAK